MSDYEVTEIGSPSTWGVEEGTGKRFVDVAASFVGASANATKPGESSPFWHRHARLEELYIVIDGAGRMALDDEVIELRPGTVVRVPGHVWRAVHCDADSPVALTWLCVRAGGESLEAIGRDGELDRERPFPWTD